MRKLLSIIVLSCAMAMAFGAYAPGARAGALTNGVLALKSDQSSFVEKARYRCWWRNGYRRCGYRHGWRHGYRHHYGWRHHRYGNYYGWRHRRYSNYYGWRHRQWQNQESGNQEWRSRYYSSHDYPYRRHYYYNSYRQPYHRPLGAPASGYCIGLCWW